MQFLFLFVFLFVSIFSGPCFAAGTEIKLENYERSAWDIGKMEIIAVTDVLGDNPGIGEELADMFAQKIRDQKFFRVLDRKQTNEMLESAQISFHDTPDQDMLHEMADTLEVDGVISGKVDAKCSTGTRYRRYYRDDYYYDNGKRVHRRIPYDVPYMNQSGVVRIDLVFYSKDKKRIIGAVRDRKSFSKDYDCYDSSYLPSDKDMIFKYAEELFRNNLYKFTPHFTIRKRNLEDADNEGTKLALKRKWNDASAVWQDQLDKNPNDFTALKNMGIYMEKKGKYNEAVDFYKKAINFRPYDPDLALYIAQAKNADLIGETLMPVDFNDKNAKLKIAKIENEKRVFINGGKELAIVPGDELLIVKKLPLFDDKITTIIGERYFKIGVFTVGKVFEGASLGEITDTSKDYDISEGDLVVIKK
ncbi:MAG: tetratricopeptide repeat protein [Firmicutes bacterium]|nr:tetratricopeptide repeat protein [Bacillota bacterium]